MSRNHIDFSRIPAWNQKKRFKMTLWMSGFIGLCSLSIGIGIFQVMAGDNVKYKSVNKETIINMLSTDPEFVKTIYKQAKLRTCENKKYKFELVYNVELNPTEIEGDSACLHFVNTHPSGEKILINISHDKRNREKVVFEEAKKFSYVQADLLTSDYRTISKISGLIANVSTTFYISEFPPGSIKVTYSPTSPVLDNEVEAMVKSIIPKD